MELTHYFMYPPASESFEWSDLYDYADQLFGMAVAKEDNIIYLRFKAVYDNDRVHGISFLFRIEQQPDGCVDTIRRHISATCHESGFLKDRAESLDSAFVWFIEPTVERFFFSTENQDGMEILDGIKIFRKALAEVGIVY